MNHDVKIYFMKLGVWLDRIARGNGDECVPSTFHQHCKWPTTMARGSSGRPINVKFIAAKSLPTAAASRVLATPFKMIVNHKNHINKLICSLN